MAERKRKYADIASEIEALVPQSKKGKVTALLAEFKSAMDREMKVVRCDVCTRVSHTARTWLPTNGQSDEKWLCAECCSKCPICKKVVAKSNFIQQVCYECIDVEVATAEDGTANEGDEGDEGDEDDKAFVAHDEEEEEVDEDGNPIEVVEDDNEEEEAEEGDSEEEKD